MEGVSYRAKIRAGNSAKKVYIGFREGIFKSCYYSHWTSFNLAKYKNSTELAIYLWELKEKKKKNFIVKKTHVFSLGNRIYKLYQEEKLTIIRYLDLKKLLNEKFEIMTVCKHARKFHLANYKPE